MSRWLPVLAVLLSACADGRGPEATDGWYGAMGALDEDVQERILYTDDGYDDPDLGNAIAQLDPLLEDFTRRFAPGDAGDVDNRGNSELCDGWEETDELPREFWAIVTLHPRLYYKGTGCTPDRSPRTSSNVRIDSEEKYYGNFFIEDDTRGIFVLNDSKVAHYSMGDKVKIRVRGVGQRFGLSSIVSHDIVEVDRGPHPIAWTPGGATTCDDGDFNNPTVCPPVDLDDPSSIEAFVAMECECNFQDPTMIGRTVRVEGTVFTEPDTFGGFYLKADDGNIYQASLDSELNRRKVAFPVGSRIEVTGPTLNAFGNPIIIMKVGQVRRL
jgi:hypothetical protein